MNAEDRAAAVFADIFGSKYTKAAGVLIVGLSTYFALKGSVDKNSSTLAGIVPKVEEMERNGHADHERRIQKLENEKASKEVITSAIEQQTKNIGELKDIVKTDHDTIVGINARMPAK